MICMSCCSISEFVRFFMSIVSTLSVGSVSDGCVRVVVESVGAGEEVSEADVCRAFSEETKCIDMVASVSGVCDSRIWSTVIGTAGLWYLRRMSSWRQNFLSVLHQYLSNLVLLIVVGVYLGPICPPLIFAPKRMCILLTSLGSTAAPGPSRMASNFVWSFRMRCERETMV